MCQRLAAFARVNDGWRERFAASWPDLEVVLAQVHGMPADHGTTKGSSLLEQKIDGLHARIADLEALVRAALGRPHRREAGRWEQHDVLPPPEPTTVVAAWPPGTVDDGDVE